MHKTQTIDAAILFLEAFLLLSIPFSWLAAGIFAAIIHELCHLLMIHIERGRVWSISIGTGGAIIDAAFPGKKEELLSTLAGPLGSLLLILLFHSYPRLSICGCIQGLYNLLPVYPLDGGRILSCCLELWKIEDTQKWLHRAENITLALILLLAIAGTMLFSLGSFPILWTILLIFKIISRKSPCKPD